MLKVKATRTGYYNHRRVYDGESFSIKKEGDFSFHWMSPVGWQPKGKDGKPVQVAQPAQPEPAPEAEPEAAVESSEVI